MVRNGLAPLRRALPSILDDEPGKLSGFFTRLIRSFCVADMSRIINYRASLVSLAFR